VSRLRPISVFVAVVVAMSLSACGGGDGGGGGDPQQTIDAATLKGIESGSLDLSFDVDARGREGGDLELSVSGPFQSGAKGDLPQIDIDATASGSAGGEELDFEGGLVLLPNTAYVNYEGTEYEVDPTTFSFAESIINPVEFGADGEAKPKDVGCDEAVGRLQVSSFVDGLRGGEGADVEGTDTTKVSGDLDITGAIDALLGLIEDPACKSQLSAAGELPSPKEVRASQDELEKSVKSAKVDVYVGEDDIVRQVSAVVELEPRQQSNGPGGTTVRFDLKLSGVNEEQDISAPEGAKPLNDLFLKLGIEPLELLSLLEGDGLTGLLEGIGSAATGAGSGGASQQEYLKCLGNARTPVDLQRCTRLSR
jgi:hypothetical protein